MKNALIIIIGLFTLLSPIGEAKSQTVQKITLEAETANTKAILTNISMALTIGYYSRGDYYLPDTGKDFETWLLIYTQSQEERTDSWGNNFLYSKEAATFEVRSAGPDGIFNNDDDEVVKGP